MNTEIKKLINLFIASSGIAGSFVGTAYGDVTKPKPSVFNPNGTPNSTPGIGVDPSVADVHKDVHTSGHKDVHTNRGHEVEDRLPEDFIGTPRRPGSGIRDQLPPDSFVRTTSLRELRIGVDPSRVLTNR